ncbi:ECF RNA polymerase sigma factor SigF [Paraburkholderia nemoris]|uniref:sigma-70 family RNA polymerase sigma factor n=1 Tax=Paraburkholderia nemoris TaxID=2793076 RepID=UPI00190C6908|nr:MULTISPECIES: sigma-70 family RNA polymerase sigma factor [Paraburkholderia]MBK3786639.1 sigma-70 family RNA polymerase sigma factor [Paraburkholderia aspalathi]MBK5122130.1 sigma-70 family RNA polymerase sigma factor [Burkholderia sp. R-69980]CAE6852193.1 ECF RNA polymerase sigma factor SigF [Paraburkholderia nemoris]
MNNYEGPPSVRDSTVDEETLRCLFLQALGGNAGAYDECLRAIAERLRLFFRKRLRAYPDEIEDLVQETLLAVYLKRHTYRVQEPLTAWIYAIARYKWVDFLRRRSLQKDISVQLDSSFDVEGIASSNSLATYGVDFDLQTLFSELPKNQQAVIAHTKIEGLTINETAQRTGMSISSVKTSIHRGLKTLASKLGGKRK